MIGTDSTITTWTQPREGEFFPIIRTSWNLESHPVEFFSYWAEFFVQLIRTQWKKQKSAVAFRVIKVKDFNNLTDESPLALPESLPEALIRTWRKIKSYLADFFRSEIRTAWNSIRTGRQARPEIIQEMLNLGPSINTFLFISKGAE